MRRQKRVSTTVALALLLGGLTTLPMSVMADGSQTDKNVAALKACYQQWNDTKGKSTDCWYGLLSESFVLRSLPGGRGDFAWTADIKGKANVERYFEGLAGEWEMIHFTTEEFIAQGDRVVMLGKTAWKNRRTGIAVESPKADVWRFDGDKAIEFMEFLDTDKFFGAARGN